MLFYGFTLMNGCWGAFFAFRIGLAEVGPPESAGNDGAGTDSDGIGAADATPVAPGSIATRPDTALSVLSRSPFSVRRQVTGPAFAGRLRDNPKRKKSWR